MTMNMPIVAVIDDDTSVLKAVGRLLRAKGFVAELFASAEEFLPRLSGAPVGCMIVDIDLTGMSGLELRRRLADTGNAPPIIFITGQADEKSKAMAVQLGCVAFLKKPFVAQALLAAIAASGMQPENHVQNEATQGKHDATS